MDDQSRWFLRFDAALSLVHCSRRVRNKDKHIGVGHKAVGERENCLDESYEKVLEHVAFKIAVIIRTLNLFWFVRESTSQNYAPG